MFTVQKMIEVTSGFATEQQNGSRNGSFGRESVDIRFCNVKRWKVNY